MDDHDILIELRTNFNAFSTQYQKDMQELKNGTAGQIADHENRLSKVEDIVTKVQPEQTMKEFRELQLSFRDQRTASRTTIRLIGVFSPIVSSVVTLLVIQIFKWLGWVQ